MRYWMLLIVASLMFVIVGCGPKDKSKAGKDAPPETDNGMIAEPPGGTGPAQAAPQVDPDAPK